MAIDALEYLEQAATPAPRPTGTFAPFFFAINDGEKALIRPLINVAILGENGELQMGVIEVHKHELYDKLSGKYIYRNICAKDKNEECAICAEVAAMPETTKEEKARKRQAEANTVVKVGNDEKISGRRFVLPVYLHCAKKPSATVPGAWEDVTYEKDGQKFPVSGVRLLEMKPDSSPIFRVLLNAYQLGVDVTTCDFKIERHLKNSFLTYDASPKPPSPFTADVEPEYLDRDLVFSLYMEACPPKRVGESTVTPASASKGIVAAAPDF